MAFGVSYKVLGRADCPYFARVERLAQMLKQSLSLNDRDIQVEMISPAAWPTHVRSLCQQLGFLEFLDRQESTDACDKGVLVFHPRTGRLVGGENAFRKEVLSKYGLKCDVGWGQLRAIAAENAASCDAIAAARAARALAQPLLISLIGAAGAGKSTLARRLAAQYGLVRVSTGDMLRRIALGSASAAGMSPSDLSAIRSSMQSGELVPDAILLPLLRARLNEEDIRRQGAILDGFPRTANQANALRDLESSLGSLAALVRLNGVTDDVLRERLEGRRIDPLTDEIYHAQLVVPESALVLSRLAVRLGDDQGGKNVAPQLRHYAQNVDETLAVFPKQVRCTLDARGSVADVYSRLQSLVDPLTQAVTARRLDAAALAAREPRPVHPVYEPSPLPTPDASPRASLVLQQQQQQQQAAPQSRGSPVPHTPETVGFSVLPELPSSRRSSMNAKTAASGSSGMASSASVGALPSAVKSSSSQSNSRRASRRGSSDHNAKDVAHALLGKQRGPQRPASSTTSSNQGSRRGSVGPATFEPPTPPPERATSSSSSSGQPPLAGGGLSRRVSARRSARTSQGGVVPAGALNASAAPAASTVTARGADSRRTSGGAALPSAISTAAASAAAASAVASATPPAEAVEKLAAAAASPQSPPDAATTKAAEVALLAAADAHVVDVAAVTPPSDAAVVRPASAHRPPSSLAPAAGSRSSSRRNSLVGSATPPANTTPVETHAVADEPVAPAAADDAAADAAADDEEQADEEDGAESAAAASARGYQELSEDEPLSDEGEEQDDEHAEDAAAEDEPADDEEEA